MRLQEYLPFDHKVVTIKFSDGGVKYCIGEEPCEKISAFEEKATANNPQASFDCAKASYPLEKVICSDPWLPAYDRRLAESYSEVAKHVGDSAALRAEQRSWLKSRAHICNMPENGTLPASFDDAKARDCLARLYDERIGVLNKMGAEWVAGSELASHLTGKWSDKCGDDEASVEMQVGKIDDKTLRISMDRDLLEFEQNESLYIVYGVDDVKDGKIGVKLFDASDPSSLIDAALVVQPDRLRIWSVIGDEGFHWVKDGAEGQGRRTHTERPWLMRCKS